ncbi:hypothetical protein VTL71DRAFT_14745 [Oculimacula yallundae]|uniref:Uncharacterized protein n=1 Tax=Oculimacula yallundae TaxID=86028 RepID=A0ABR4CJC1_9HELO
MSKDQYLPSPEEDITKTSHFRTFKEGSGGPHLDVLLHNQRTIVKQNQDIRRLVEHLLQGQRSAKGLGSAGKRAPLVGVDLEESLREGIIQASRRYNDIHQDMKLLRGKSITKTVEKWVAALEEDEELGDEEKEALRGMESDKKVALHIQCAEKIRGKTKIGGTKRSKGKKKAPTKGTRRRKESDESESADSDVNSEANSEDEEEGLADETDEDITEHRRKRTRHT